MSVADGEPAVGGQRADDRVALAFRGNFAQIELRREAKRNALDASMMAGIASCCAEIERAAQVRAVVISGVGEGFCCGGDVAAWGGETPEDFGNRWVRDGHDALDALARLRQPVIAAIGGLALGGGLELAACADLRIAEAQARFGQPETGIGIIPGWSGTQRAVRRFGAGVVRRMALFGEVFDAEQALALGLVDRVVPEGRALEAATEVVAIVSGRGRRATELAKMMINAAEGEERERVIEALAGTVAAGSPELAEGLAAFREKRRPDFSAFAANAGAGKREPGAT